MSGLNVRPDHARLKLSVTAGVRPHGALLGEIVFSILALVATIAAGALGFLTARKFVRDRLKFVDAAQTLKAPILAGLVAWAVATPLTWVLPLVGAGTAALFGVSVGLGVRAGARDIRVDRRLTGGSL